MRALLIIIALGIAWKVWIDALSAIEKPDSGLAHWAHRRLQRAIVATLIIVTLFAGGILLRDLGIRPNDQSGEGVGLF